MSWECVQSNNVWDKQGDIFFARRKKSSNFECCGNSEASVTSKKKKINRIMQLLIFRSFSYEFYFIGTHQIYNSHTNNDGICFIIY